MFATPGLLDCLKQEKGPARLVDLAELPDFAGFTAGDSTVRTFLATPISARDEVVGILCLAEKEGEPEFTDGDQTIAAMLATQATSIIANARRYDEARQIRENMERLMDLCPIAVSTFNVRLGEVTCMNSVGGARPREDVWRSRVGSRRQDPDTGFNPGSKIPAYSSPSAASLRLRRG